MDDPDFISKTRRKREAHELQDLGKALSQLSLEQLARFDLPDNLRAAVLEVKGMTKHEAIRRQMQYVGKMMRNLDCEPIAAQLAALHAPSRQQTALFHVAEKWRDALVEDPQAIVRFVQEFPGADAGAIAKLAAQATAEREGERSPHNFRKLFHAITAVVNGEFKGKAR
jgi:ribosome-associated protein